LRCRCRCEVVDEALRLLDHEVTIEDLLGHGSQGRDHGGTDRQVGDEVAVHHIDVDEVRARFVDRSDLLAKAGKIGAENRRGDERGLRGHGRDLSHPRRDDTNPYNRWRFSRSSTRSA